MAFVSLDPEGEALASAIASSVCARIVRELPARVDYTTLDMTRIFEAYHRELTQSDRDPKTIVRYWQIISSYQRWLGDNRQPDTASAKEFLSHLRDKGYRPKSVLLYYSALKLFLEFIGQPLKLKLRKPRVLPPYYDRGDVEALIAYAGRARYRSGKQRQRNQAIILTLAYTGMRRGELLGLLIGDIDFNRRTILVRGKGNKERVIPMAERIIVPLRGQCAGKLAQDKVFLNVDASGVWRVVTRLAKDCGLHGFHTHSLRHYFATQLVEKGASLRDIQALLGHESLEVTSIYLDVSAQHLRETVELLDSVRPTPAPQSTHSRASDGGFGPW